MFCQEVLITHFDLHKHETQQVVQMLHYSYVLSLEDCMLEIKWV